MKADKILYPGTVWWMLLLLPAVFFGFYPTYFSKLGSPMDRLLHVHTFFMAVWVALAILQPLLIRYKKIRRHKTLGKLSYFIMAGALVTGYLTIRLSYQNRIEEVDTAEMAADPSKLAFIQEDMYISMIYLSWLACFYLLAIFNRRRMLYHATFMFAAVLTVLGPTLDRIIFRVYRYYGRGFDLFAEYAVFCLIDLLLAGLLFYQWRKGYNTKPVLISLAIYLSGQLAYMFLPQTQVWKKFVAIVLS